MIGILVLGLVIYRQLIPRRVKSNMRIVLILAVIGLIETGQYLHGRHLDATLIAEILGSLVLAAVFGLARASTVRLFYKDGQWWTRGSWVTAILWVASVAAHLGVRLPRRAAAGPRQPLPSATPRSCSTWRSRYARAAHGRHRALAAHGDSQPERDNRPDLTGPARRAMWLVVYPGAWRSA